MAVRKAEMMLAGVVLPPSARMQISSSRRKQILPKTPVPVFDPALLHRNLTIV